MRLLGRQNECEALTQLLTEVTTGNSRILVLRGEAGVGKSALLDFLSERAGASGAQLERSTGVESEMELAYSGLHQLCEPMLGHLERLPDPQGEALATAFGLRNGKPPDRFLVGLAVLSLFADVAEQQPLVCIVDDAQWLDHMSAEILAFVARRLFADPVALVCAARTGIGDDHLAGLPQLVVGPLLESDARTLLLETVPSPLDPAVVDEILAESHGNPLALLEFWRTWSTEDLAGGFGLPESPIESKVEARYVRRLHRLPSETQLLALAAAAEPLGDPLLLQAAAKVFRLDMSVLDPAVDAGLLKVGRRVEFTHPLVRSSIYRSAAVGDRHRVHQALADATSAVTDPDRRAWHRARAAAGPDEEVAIELERSAGRAQARGGVAAAAAFLRRAVELSEDPQRRSERALAAAETNFLAGAFDTALALVNAEEAGKLSQFQLARVDLLRGNIGFATGRNGDTASLLLNAARRLETFDLELARETYLTAWGAAFVYARQPGGGKVFREIRHAVQALPERPTGPRPLDLLLDGLVILSTEGHAAATPRLEAAAKALMGISVEDILRWGWMATAPSNAVWDNDGALTIAARQVKLVRAAGALAQLPLHLDGLALSIAWNGDFVGAEALIAEGESVASATGSQPAPWAALRLRALQGREVEAAMAINSAIARAAAEGQNFASYAHWAASVLYNGLSRYHEAAASAGFAANDQFEYWVSVWALPELVEAGVRAADIEIARDAFERLQATTQPADTDFGRGVEARSQALLSDGAAAENLFLEAIDRLSRTGLRPEIARAHLLYGEWMRREGRRVDAREQLRTAHDLFQTIGMDAFGQRARRELAATGEKVRKRSPETRFELTPQEQQIARLAAEGLTNLEIGAQLFISARTVEWHMRKVFTKLDITSRRQLRTVLPEGIQSVATA